LGKVFATEFFLTFFLTYIAFTVAFEDAENQKKESMSFKTISDSKGLTLYASTPQSKTGFAPFSIGLTIFSLNLLGGASGGAFNPGRIFGPAIFSGKWEYVYIYWLGELFGAAAAGLLVNNIHRLGIQTNRLGDDVTAKDVIEKTLQVPIPTVAPLQPIEDKSEGSKNPLNANIQV
jgi:glycerol uptake facilitator-like aquaporin